MVRSVFGRRWWPRRWRCWWRARAGARRWTGRYKQEVTWTNAPVVQVFTNTVVVTNTVPLVMERTNVVYVTNAATGAVSGYVAREPVATNLVTAVVTNFVPVF